MAPLCDESAVSEPSVPEFPSLDGTSGVDAAAERGFVAVLSALAISSSRQDDTGIR